MSENLEHDPVGQKVIEILVDGAKYDKEHVNRIDVDLQVRLTDLSRWLLHVVTEEEYIHTGQRDAEEAANDQSHYQSDEVHQPVVVPAKDISDAELAKLLASEPISPELARHMAYIEPEPEE